MRTYDLRAQAVFYSPADDENTLERHPMTATTIATWLVRAGALYASIGLLFAAYLLARGLSRFDGAAAHAGWGFKLLVLPGMVALWPLLVRRLFGGGPPDERNAHDRAALGARR